MMGRASCIDIVRPSRLAKKRAPRDEEHCARPNLLIPRCGAKRSLEGRTKPVQRAGFAT